jgi:hypothetical protein
MYYLIQDIDDPSGMFIADTKLRGASFIWSHSIADAIRDYSSSEYRRYGHLVFNSLLDQKLTSNESYIVAMYSATLNPASFRPFTGYRQIQSKRRHHASKTTAT